MSPIFTEEGSAIKGAKIIGEARKISEPRVISKTGRHKAQRTILRDKAICWIDKELKYLK
jgi:hypothetical protein